MFFRLQYGKLCNISRAEAKPLPRRNRRTMKKISAILITVALVAAFALALTACNPVEKTETFSATPQEMEEICKDKPSAYSHYQVTSVTGGATSSFEVYLIDYDQLPDSYALPSGYSIYVIETRTDNSHRYRLATGQAANALYGDAIVNADGSVQYSYAVSRSNFDLANALPPNKYTEAYGIKDFPTASAIHGEFKGTIGDAKSALSNAIANGECVVTAERHIKGKDVVSKKYTLTFDLEDGSAKSKGTVTAYTDGNDNLTEISVTWENGDSVTTKYIEDGTGEVGYENIFTANGDNPKFFFELCGVPEKDLTKQ